MGLKRIFINYHKPNTMEVIAWFHDMFGDAQEWEGEVLEPVQLKHGHQWANGRHRLQGFTNSSPCIWCTDKAYMMYKLRWL